MDRRNPLLDDGDSMATPSFIERALRAPDDDDGDFAMTRNLNYDNANEETELQQLIRHWVNERHAPDILPGQENLLASLLDHIRRQVGECFVLCGGLSEELTGVLKVKHRPAIAIGS